MTEPRIGLVGYGEVGRILTGALKQRGLAWVGAYDILFGDNAKGPGMRAAARDAGIHAAGSLAELLSQADIVFSAVTASNAHDVAVAAAEGIRTGAYFVDLNSCSPGTKAESAALIEGAGGHFVESAVMASVPPYGIRVPMLLGGKAAPALAEKLVPLGFAMTVVAEKVGVASAIKMCRSVVMKGMEAIVVESFSTARKHGVEDYVIASLAETFPGLDWEKQGSYFFGRVIAHGKRRAEEMREVDATVGEAGFPTGLSAAIADKHDWLAALGRAGTFEGLGFDGAWRDYADRILAGQTKRGK